MTIDGQQGENSVLAPIHESRKVESLFQEICTLRPRLHPDLREICNELDRLLEQIIPFQHLPHLVARRDGQSEDTIYHFRDLPRQQ